MLIKNLITLAFASCLITACASTGAMPNSTFMATGNPVIAPSGFSDLCAQDRAECDPGGDSLIAATPSVSMTPALWSLLQRTNRDANTRIRPATDEQLYGVGERWTDPLEGHLTQMNFIAAGDCEDYALAKRDLLLLAGWPAEAMFLAIGYHPELGPHAVLVVRTDQGDLVLDSRSPWIKGWKDTPYIWVKRQVAADSLEWVEAFAPRVTQVASTAANDAVGAVGAPKS